ncbi:copper homeostasis protein CutC [Camelliibacillus cellulosilyticus]|uniref:PF03932 family protein CutC n=1 Tax=Camelliibacillus cellulosilyticus TaxID=2174486 RepID=A0ABV9GPH0_9BACL
MIIEVIATSVEDAKIIAANGADRIELVTGMAEGGLTPSYGLIEGVVKAVTIPVNVMIRPHSRSFYYSEEDIQTMLKDIEIVKNIGAAGMVIGTLTPDNEIDEQTLQRLLAVSGDLDVTFHRAFDEVEQSKQVHALQTIMRYPKISRVLTSGGKPKAPEAAAHIKRLVEETKGTHFTILAGSGLTADNLPQFIKDTGVPEIHVGSAVREAGDGLRPVDGRKIQALYKRIDQ